MKNPTISTNPDTKLLALVADFWMTHRDHEEKGEISHACYAKMEAMPDFPDDPAPDLGTPEREKWGAAHAQCADASGYPPAYDLWCKAGKCMGKAANAVFAIPAKTLKGAVEKLKVARVASGAVDETGDGDADLSCYQDAKTPWIDNAIADLERLAAVPVLETGPDPAMTAFVELKAAETALTETERLVDAETLDENAPEVGAIRKKDTDALEQFADTEPTTVQGAITKLQYLVDDGPADAVDVRNVRTIIAYLEGAAGVQVAQGIGDVPWVFLAGGALLIGAVVLALTQDEFVITAPGFTLPSVTTPTTTTTTTP